MTSRPTSNGVFGVERPVARSSTSSSCAPNDEGSKYSQLYYRIQKLEDREQFEEGIRLRWDALMMMLDDGLLHTNPTSLAADVDEYIRRVNFTALIHINNRRFRDAERLLIGAQQLVVDAPNVVLFNEAVPSLKATKRRCLAVIENNLGLCDFKAGRFANAEVHFFTAASMEEELPTADNPGATLFNLARVQQSLGKHSVAFDCATAATEHLRAKYQTVGLLMVQIDEIRQLLVHCLALQADAATSAHRYPIALDALSEAIKVASEGHREESASLIESLEQQRLACDAARRRFRAKKELDKRYPKRAASEEASRRCHSMGKRPVNEQLAPYLIKDQVSTSCLPNDGPLHRHLELSNRNFQIVQQKQMHFHDDDASFKQLSTPQPVATHRTPSATRAAQVIRERKEFRAATSSFESYLSGTAGGIALTPSPYIEQQQNEYHQQKPPLHVPTRPRSATTNAASNVVPISASTLPQLSAKGSSRPSSSDRYIRTHHSNTALLHAASESLIKRGGRSSLHDQENVSAFPLDASNPAYFTHQPGLKAVYNSLKDEDRQAFDELSKIPVRPDTAPLPRSTNRPSTASHTVRPPHVPKEGGKSRPYSQATRRPLSASTSRSVSASSRKSSPISNREGSLSKSEMHKKFMKLTQSDAAYENALEYHKRVIAVDIVHAIAAGYKARLRCALTQHQQQLALSRLRAAIRAEVREEERVSTCRATDALVASRNIKIAQLEARLKEADDLLRAEAARIEKFEAIQEQRREEEVRLKELEEEAAKEAALQSTIESIASERHTLDERDVTLVQTWLRVKSSQHHTKEMAAITRTSMLAAWSEKNRVEVALKTLKRLEPAMVVAIRARKLQSEEELSRGRCIMAEETVSAAIKEALTRELNRVKRQEQCKAAKLVLERCLLGWLATQKVQNKKRVLKVAKENLSARRIQHFMCMVVAMSQRKRLHSRWIEEIYHNKHDFAATKIQSIWRMAFCFKLMQQPLKAHSEKLQAEALKEARRLRQIASIPVIQRAYRCHLARRLVAYAMKRRQEVKMKYIVDQMQLDAVLTLQRFALIVRAKGVVRRQRYVMSNIIRYREYQRARLLEEECSRRTTHIAMTLLQRCGRGAQVRFALRRYRVRRVEAFENGGRKVE